MSRTVTHCKHGHLFDDANTYIARGGKRQCRACVRDRMRILRTQRYAARPAPTRDYQVPPTTDLLWAAGLFEGEGTATIGGKGPYSAALISVTSIDLEVLDFYQLHWGGRIRSVGRRSPNAREAFTWELHGQRAAFFAEDLLPHIRTSRVRQKFEILVESQQHRRQGSRNPSYQAIIGAYREQLRLLNRRGERH
jgi:hypothetical protein